MHQLIKITGPHSLQAGAAHTTINRDYENKEVANEIEKQETDRSNRV